MESCCFSHVCPPEGDLSRATGRLFDLVENSARKITTRVTPSVASSKPRERKLVEAFTRYAKYRLASESLKADDGLRSRPLPHSHVTVYEGELELIDASCLPSGLVGTRGATPPEVLGEAVCKAVRVEKVAHEGRCRAALTHAHGAAAAARLANRRQIFHCKTAYSARSVPTDRLTLVPHSTVATIGANDMTGGSGQYLLVTKITQRTLLLAEALRFPLVRLYLFGWGCVSLRTAIREYLTHSFKGTGAQIVTPKQLATLYASLQAIPTVFHRSPKVASPLPAFAWDSELALFATAITRTKRARTLSPWDGALSSRPCPAPPLTASAVMCPAPRVRSVQRTAVWGDSGALPESEARALRSAFAEACAENQRLAEQNEALRVTGPKPPFPPGSKISVTDNGKLYRATINAARKETCGWLYTVNYGTSLEHSVHETRIRVRNT